MDIEFEYVMANGHGHMPIHDLVKYIHLTLSIGTAFIHMFDATKA